MTEYNRAISPPLPPDPVTAAPSKSKTTRDSVIDDNIPSLAASTLRHSESTLTAGSDDLRPGVRQQATLPQPIRDAVDKAFDQSVEQSATTTQLDPSFIAQVTEAVVKNLVNANIGVATSQSSSQYPAPPSSPPLTSEPATQSPVLSDASLPTTYTPPSPHRERPRPHDSVNTIPLPVTLEDDDGDDDDSLFSQQREQHIHSALDQDDVSSDDANEVRGNAFDDRRRSRYASTGDASTGTKNVRRESRRSSGRLGISTSTPATSATQGDEPTALEKAWQPLFDSDGKPTSRFSQFVRGIALHIINEYPPKGSLVIAPGKLLQFFEETRVENEPYPWQIILGGSTSCASISTIYRRLKCQHHLVQNSLQEPPNLPALTPQGFEWLMSCLVQAHPDQGYERLSQAVRDLPISNADNLKERFPKELSRRLLPSVANAQAEQRLIASMAHEPNIRLRNSSSMPPPPPAQPPAAAPQSTTQQGPILERQRMPYNGAPHSNAFDDDDLASNSNTPSAPIERERKPYVAREGGGKFHTDSDHDRHASHSRADNPVPLRPSRQDSSSGIFASSGSTPPEGRAAGRTRINTGPGSQPPLSYTNSSMGRNAAGRRSPPLSRSYSRSDGPSIDPSTMYAHRMSAPNIDDGRYNPRRATASSTVSASDEDPRGQPIPQRAGQTTSVQDSSYGSGSMPPPPPTLASSGSNRQRRFSTAASSYDDRRRSTYPASSSGSGVSDGWANSSDHHVNQAPRPGQSYMTGSGPNGGPTNH